ncbi:DUF4258 domain-containing protein [Candidatus Woesearchaeota archaeon]|nr:DUF4258 domain-containing protein [Candidatus Woesearchaeota archaeon]
MNIIFTDHAEFRLLRRKILKEEVVYAIKYPDNTLKKHGKYFFQKRLDRGIIEVVCETAERDIKVITLYWV